MRLEVTTPYNLEIQNFIANRLWAQGLQDEATEVYERAYKQALAHIPKGYKGQIAWGEVLMCTNQPALPSLGARHLSRNRRRSLGATQRAWRASGLQSSFYFCCFNADRSYVHVNARCV